MPGFESLPGAENAALAQQEIRAEQVAFNGEECTDEAALQIVTQDVQLAEQFINSKRQPQQWESADNMFRAYVASMPWPGTDVPRSNLSMPVILEAIEALMPTVHLAFFSDRQPFLLEPLGNTTPQAARAKEKLLLWAIKESGFKEEMRRCIKHWLLYGFTAAKWGWKTSTRIRKSYKQVDQGPGKQPRVEKTEEDYDVSHPTFELVELRNVLFDPSLREQDCRKGKWVCAQVFVTGYDLDAFRDDPAYHNIPSREELAGILARQEEPTEDSMQGSKFTTNRDLQAKPQVQESTVDPLGQPLELLEYTTDRHVFTVLQRKIVIRNERNGFNKKNFLSCAFIDVPGSMYGFGISKLLGGEQRFQTGVVNSWIDQLALQLNPAYVQEKGVGPGVQNISLSPGKIINSGGALVPLQKESVTKEALDAIQTSEARSSRRVGSNGGDNMPTQAMRTAEGVNSFNQGVVDKLQYEIEIFADMVFIPALEAFLEVCKDNLQPEDIKKILSDSDGKAYEGDVLDIYNGACQIQVLSSTKLASRRAAAQLLPMLLQLVQAGPVQESLAAQNKKFNYVELLDEALGLTGWDVDSLVIDASPQEVQQAMQMTSGGAQQGKMQAQLQGQAQLEQQKNADALQQIEATGLARAGVVAIKHVLDQSAKPADTAIPESFGG